MLQSISSYWKPASHSGGGGGGEHAERSLGTQWRVSTHRDVTRDRVEGEHAERSLGTKQRVSAQRDR